MRTLIALCLFGLTIPLPAQTPLRTFTSPDGIFQFKYSDMLVDCASLGKQENGTGSSVPEACMSQGSICGGMGSEEATLACFAYPKERFKDKDIFVAATFYVSEILSAKTEEVCLKGSPDWFVIKSKAETTTINHITFKAFEIGDNWTSGGQSGPAYRTFHKGKCYELGIQNVVSRAVYDPGTVKKFTKKDSSEVQSRLRQPLNSFVFLK
ncbi:MAG: hypothetical protein WBV69_14975 [Candidatus Sulfotelmatobacter sp.]